MCEHGTHKDYKQMGILFSQSLYIRKQHSGGGTEIHYCMEIKIGYDLFNTLLAITR